MTEQIKEPYAYFEKDGAYFRRDESRRAMSVDDVLVNGKWTPSKGDRFGAAMWGDRITEADLPL